MITTVLIVEDERLQAMALKSIFTSLGLHVIGLASSCEEAVGKTRNQPPDLIIMDIQLEGDRTGVDAAQEIRSFCNCPIVFQSACTDATWIQKALRFPLSVLLNKSTGIAEWALVVQLFDQNQIQMVA